MRLGPWVYYYQQEESSGNARRDGAWEADSSSTHLSAHEGFHGNQSARSKVMRQPIIVHRDLADPIKVVFLASALRVCANISAQPSETDVALRLAIWVRLDLIGFKIYPICRVECGGWIFAVTSGLIRLTRGLERSNFAITHGQPFQNVLFLLILFPIHSSDWLVFVYVLLLKCRGIEDLSLELSVFTCMSCDMTGGWNALRDLPFALAELLST